MGKHGNSERLYLGGSKITADGDSCHEIWKWLLLGRKFMTNLDSIIKSRDLTLPTKFHSIKAMVFPFVMYECVSWNIQKAEFRRIDAFELWYWIRLLRVPWPEGDPTSPSERKSVLIIRWQYWCWSWNSNTLATWCKEPTHLKRHLCWVRLKAGGEEDDREWVGWMASLTQWTWI